MNTGDYFVLLSVMAFTTYLIRVLPFLAFKRKLKGKFINSFLYYVVYAVLASMSFPYAFLATGNVITAAAGIIAAFILAIMGKGLVSVALTACFISFITGLLL